MNGSRHFVFQSLLLVGGAPAFVGSHRAGSILMWRRTVLLLQLSNWSDVISSPQQEKQCISVAPFFSGASQYTSPLVYVNHFHHLLVEQHQCCCRTDTYPALLDRKFTRMSPFRTESAEGRVGRIWLSGLEFGLDTRDNAGFSQHWLLFRSAWGKLGNFERQASCQDLSAYFLSSPFPPAFFKIKKWKCLPLWRTVYWPLCQALF